MNVDMSPRAITDRLRLASKLAALCLALGKARPVAAESEGQRAIADKNRPVRD
jgi:hypothetical protein